MPREVLQYLFDILTAISQVEQFLRGHDETTFTTDLKTQFAVMHAMLIIGEAAGKLPPQVTQQAPTVDWRRIVGLRNFIAHEYFGVDRLIIWDVAKNKLPDLRQACLALLEIERGDGG